MIGMIRRMMWCLFALALFAVAWLIFMRVWASGTQLVDAMVGGMVLTLACMVLWDRVLRP